jgi:Cap4 SAVED domain
MRNNHPEPPEFGCYTTAVDGVTVSGNPHRSLTQNDDDHDKTIAQIRSALIRHHVSPDMIERDRRKIANLIKLGYTSAQASVTRFPRTDKTKKGNLAEVFLAEYLGSATEAELPIYRLRYNTNVDQSMKGDDVLAFDFSGGRTRIIIGESKFRKIPNKVAVEEIVSGLIRSQQAGLPASLQFIADRLYDKKDKELADKVSECSLQMANGRLDLSYVGLLLSNTDSKAKVDKHTNGTMTNLVMISLGVVDPNQLVSECFDGIEGEAYADPD